MLTAQAKTDIAKMVARSVERYAAQRKVSRYTKDAHGHEHKGKGPGGGQFTSSGNGGNSGAGSSGKASGTTASSASKKNAGTSQKQEFKPGHKFKLRGGSVWTFMGSGRGDDGQTTTVFRNGSGENISYKGDFLGENIANGNLTPLSESGQQTPSGSTSPAMQDANPKNDPKTPPPPGQVYNPNPADGKAARVGVPGDVVPPPPKEIPRLPNLNPDERAVENKFATMFESDPDGMARKAREAMNNGMGDGPTIFATDEMKNLFDEWKGSKVTGPDGKSDLSPETKAFRSKFNTALHQTANALAKRAFLQHLDEVVSKLPEDKRQVLVTAGGVAAGKGYAIANVGSVNQISQLAAATWDSAGEQNSTELPWLAEECKKRGIKMTAVFVHSNPQETWENPQRGVIERAGKKGRMVDARVFADSYTHGARNFHEFQQKFGNDPAIRTFVLDNTQKTPSPLNQVPTEMLTMDPEALYSRCLQALDTTPNVPEAVKAGGSAGARIWGKPQV